MLNTKTTNIGFRIPVSTWTGALPITLRYLKLKYCANIIIGVCILSVTATTAAAQQERSITSDYFTNQRPVAKGVKSSSKSKSTSKKKKKSAQSKNWIYTLISDDGTGRQKPEKSLKAQTTIDIGVTIWKLRPPRPSEKGAVLFPVIGDDGEQKMWLAERVGGEMSFRSGDRVRFAIESSVVGYLYVIGRESYSDGGYGRPYPVFPASATDDNSVGPGILVDIPDQGDNMPFFKIDPKKPNYTGERLTVVISPKELNGLTFDNDRTLQNSDELADLESRSEVEIYSRPPDPTDKIYSKAESEASCGGKRREFVREEASGKPCGVNSRELTREEARPQSIHRIKGSAGQPAVAFVRLAVRH